MGDTESSGQPEDLWQYPCGSWTHAAEGEDEKTVSNFRGAMGRQLRLGVLGLKGDAYVHFMQER